MSTGLGPSAGEAIRAMGRMTSSVIALRTSVIVALFVIDQDCGRSDFMSRFVAAFLPYSRRKPRIPRRIGGLTGQTAQCDIVFPAIGSCGNSGAAPLRRGLRRAGPPGPAASIGESGRSVIGQVGWPASLRTRYPLHNLRRRSVVGKPSGIAARRPAPRFAARPEVGYHIPFSCHKQRALDSGSRTFQKFRR
jgi:hypothetical protein